MPTTDRQKALKEWKEILRDHPSFARASLAQQAILMDAAESGDRLVDRNMFRLLSAGLPVLFEDYWTKRSDRVPFRATIANDQIRCLSELNRDPARCFNLDPGDPPWFDDPFAGDPTFPPLGGTGDRPGQPGQGVGPVTHG